jgi:hypothetical protein
MKVMNVQPHGDIKFDVNEPDEPDEPHAIRESEAFQLHRDIK